MGGRERGAWSKVTEGVMTRSFPDVVKDAMCRFKGPVSRKRIDSKKTALRRLLLRELKTQQEEKYLKG